MHLREVDANLLVVLDVLLIDASVTKAAQRLGRSPSAVSHALSSLRKLFDDDLFIRAGQRLVPTAKAMEIAPAVHVIVAGMESLIRPSSPFDPSTEERDFKISCPVEFELTLFPELKRILDTDAPNVGICRNSKAGADCLEDLRHGTIHFLISETPPQEAIADIVTEHLYDDELVTVANKKHPMIGKRVSLARFSNAEHIGVSDGATFADPVLNVLSQKERPANISIEVSSLLVGLLLAARSNALLTIPRSVFQSVATCVPLADIKQPVPTQKISYCLSWHRSHDRDKCHVWLREVMMDIAKRL